jgi:hypothetical protein
LSAFRPMESTPEETTGPRAVADPVPRPPIDVAAPADADVQTATFAFG